MHLLRSMIIPGNLRTVTLFPKLYTINNDRLEFLSIFIVHAGQFPWTPLSFPFIMEDSLSESTDHSMTCPETNNGHQNKRKKTIKCSNRMQLITYNNC